MDEQKKKISRAGFVETTTVNFFQEHELESLQLKMAKETRQSRQSKRITPSGLNTLQQLPCRNMGAVLLFLQ